MGRSGSQGQDQQWGRHVHLAHAGAHLPLHLALLGLVLALLSDLEHSLWAGQQWLGPHQFGDLQGMILPEIVPGKRDPPGAGRPMCLLAALAALLFKRQLTSTSFRVSK